MSNALADIRAKLDGETRDEALSLLNQYLLDHPDDTEARLTKAETSFQAKIDYEFIGFTLATIASDDAAQHDRIVRLRQKVEERAWDLIGSGRSRMRTRMGGDPIADFDNAVLLRPRDPVVALAAALALLRHNGGSSPFDDLLDDDDRESSSSSASSFNPFSFGRASRPGVPPVHWNPAIERYLRRVIELSEPGYRLHEVAVVCLIKHLLNANKLSSETLTLMETLGEPRKTWLAVYDELINRVLLLVHDTAAGFLRAGDPASARRILAACEAEGLQTPRLLLLEADRHPVGSSARRTAFRKALRLADAARPTPTLAHLKPLLTLAQGIQYKCRICGREIRPTSESCQFCESRQATHALLVDRFELRDPDYAVAALHIGCAEAMEAAGKPAAALAELHRALALLPSDYGDRDVLASFRKRLAPRLPIRRLSRSRSPRRSECCARWSRQASRRMLSQRSCASTIATRSPGKSSPPHSAPPSSVG
ncbi:MAG: hypothetical protein IPK19_37535 [Chloroflexi bacterium]|nr:hypothetical protein [Chloroflexota bacterium]